MSDQTPRFKFRIACDCDDVLVYFAPLMAQKIMENRQVKQLDWTNYNLGLLQPEEVAICQDAVLKIWKSVNMESLPFKPGAVDGFNALARDHTVEIFSAVPAWCQEDREKNLSELKYQKLHCCGDNSEKTTRVLKFTPDIVIDDSPKFLREIHGYDIGVQIYFPTDIAYTHELIDDGIGKGYDSWSHLVRLIEDFAKMRELRGW